MTTILKSSEIIPKSPTKWGHKITLTPFSSEGYVPWTFPFIKNELNFSNIITFQITPLKELNDLIEEARYLTKLDVDWDGEGSIPVSKETYENAKLFLHGLSNYWLRNLSRDIIPLPHIGYGPEGSIDLYWKESLIDFVINIPNHPNSIATFYGDDQKDTFIKGKFNLKDSPPIGIFLTILEKCH